MEPKILGGAYSIDITPPVVFCDHPFHEKKWPVDNILDPLYANALVLDDGETEIALVSVDTTFITCRAYRHIAKEIESMCGIKRENVLITATHTHSAPTILTPDMLMDYIDDNTPQDEYSHNQMRRSGMIDSEKDLTIGLKNHACNALQKIATAVAMAQKNKEPVRIGAGEGKNIYHSKNRRLVREDGSIVMIFAKRSSFDDLSMNDTNDPQMHLIKVEKADGRTLAMFINYSVHNLSRVPQGFTADMAGAMRDVLKNVYGKDTVVLFTPGTQGNMTWRDMNNTDTRQDRHIRLGLSLASTVLQIDSELEYLDVDRISCLQTWLELEERPFQPYDTEADYTFGPPEMDHYIYTAQKYFYEERKDMELQKYSVPITAIRLGENIAFAAVPGEMFVEFGLDFKQKMREMGIKYGLMYGLTNGEFGYIPTRKAFDEGGYEVRKYLFSFLEKGAGDKITAKALEMVEEI